MDEARFTVVFGGESLKNHTMDVRDLAPAMLSLGQLIDESNRVLYGDRTAVKLHVQAAEPGCFELSFLLDMAYISQVWDWLASEDANSAVNLFELIFFGAAGVGSLIGLARWLKGKLPTKVETVDEDTVRLTMDGQSYDVPLKLLRMYQDIAVRRALENTISPLKKEGIETFDVKSNGQVIQTIKKEEVDYYTAPKVDEEELLDAVERSAYTIVSLAFKEDNKWRLYDGNNTITAAIKDEEFNQRVDQGLESFTKGDVLICDVRKRQYMTDTGLKTDYEVERVIEHKRAAKQIHIDFEPPEGE